MLELIDLDVTIRPVAAMKVFGHRHDVMPLDGRSQRILGLLLNPINAAEKKATKMALAKEAVQNQERMDEIVAQVVPSMSAEDRDRLTLELRMQIVQLAGKQIEAVKAAITAANKTKNVTRPLRLKK